MSAPGSGLDQFGRFARPARQVLRALTAGPREPLVIRHDLQERCAIDLGPGTLFGTIARLERHALIEVVAAPRAPRAYRLTALGAKTLEAQLAAVRRPASSASSASSSSTPAAVTAPAAPATDLSPGANLSPAR